MSDFVLGVICGISLTVIVITTTMSINEKQQQQLEITCKQTESKAGLVNKVYLCVEN